MELAPPTRLFALIDIDAAPGFEMEGPLALQMVELRLSGASVPPWEVLGLTKDGGVRPLGTFETLSEAKSFAEQRFPAMGMWQPVPARPLSEGYMTTLLPGHTHWRIQNIGDNLRGADIQWTRFDPRIHGDHDHCSGCWAKFMDKEKDPNILRYGFRTPDEGWLCEKCYHDLKEYLRLRTELP
jgi:hypothetical protein